MPTRVVIAEDNYLVREGVVRLLETCDDVAVVGVAGERAMLEGGRRTATLQARTKCRVAVAAGDAVDRDALAALSEGHRREEQQ